MTKRRSEAPDQPSVTPNDTVVGREHDRPVAAGGRLRLVLGFLLGALIGALLALVLPRDDGPRRARPAVPADAADPVVPPPRRP